MIHEDTRYPDRTDDYPNKYPDRTDDYPNKYPDRTDDYPNKYPDRTDDYPNKYPDRTDDYPNKYPDRTDDYPNTNYAETDRCTDGYTEACKKGEHDMVHEDARYTDTGLYKNIGELIRDCARDMSIDELEAWADDVDIALMAARKERGRKSVECHTLASELDNIMEVLKEKRCLAEVEALKEYKGIDDANLNKLERMIKDRHFITNVNMFETKEKRGEFNE